MIHVDVANEQSDLPVDPAGIDRAVRAVLAEEGVSQARISVAVVDDPTIAELNRRYLDHEGPTDVLSFLLEQGPGGLEGEVVTSAATALRRAGEFGWSAGEELILYVIHGTLHLAGYDDGSEPQRREMRRRERACLARLGVEMPPAEPARYEPAGANE